MKTIKQDYPKQHALIFPPA